MKHFKLFFILTLIANPLLGETPASEPLHETAEQATPESPDTFEDQDGEAAGWSNGAVAGIALACCLVSAGLVGGAWIVERRHRNTDIPALLPPHMRVKAAYHYAQQEVITYKKLEHINEELRTIYEAILPCKDGLHDETVIDFEEILDTFYGAKIPTLWKQVMPGEEPPQLKKEYTHLHTLVSLLLQAKTGVGSSFRESIRRLAQDIGALEDTEALDYVIDTAFSSTQMRRLRLPTQTERSSDPRSTTDPQSFVDNSYEDLGAGNGESDTVKRPPNDDTDATSSGSGVEFSDSEAIDLNASLDGVLDSLKD